MNKENYAKQFHDLYERYAPDFGYETRKDTKQFDPETPNGRLMTKVCNEVISQALQKRDEVWQKYVMLTLEKCVTAKSEDGKTMFLRVDAKEFEEGLSTLTSK